MRLSLKERTDAADRAFLLLLAGAARRFGELWEADLCDFVDVTIGLRQLHLLLSTVSSEVEAEVDIAPDARRVLLLPAPGETHGFGIAMVQYSFRAAGWRADYGLSERIPLPAARRMVRHRRPLRKLRRGSRIASHRG